MAPQTLDSTGRMQLQEGQVEPSNSRVRETLTADNPGVTARFPLWSYKATFQQD